METNISKKLGNATTIFKKIWKCAFAWFPSMQPNGFLQKLTFENPAPVLKDAGSERLGWPTTRVKGHD